MFIIGIDKQAMAECLVAFCHSRIVGIAGQGQEGVTVFRNRYVEKDAVGIGADMANILKDLSTIDIINQKIKSANSYVSNLYYNYYSKLTYLMDKHIKANQNFVEGLIGFHLLKLATEKGILNQDNLEAYKQTISLYENEKYTKDEEVREVILNMREISQNIFEDYLRKKKRGKK